LDVYKYEEMKFEWNFKGKIQVEIVVCVRMQGIYNGWYPETPIIIQAQIEYNGLCREE